MKDMTCCVDWATQLAEFYSALKSDKNEEENTVAVDEVELVEVVGSGGEATVYAVVYKGEACAFKSFTIDPNGSLADKEDVSAECNAEYDVLKAAYAACQEVPSCADKHHKNVINVDCLVSGKEVTATGGSLMESLGNSTAWLDANFSSMPLDLAPASAIAMQACRGTCAFHDAGYAHCDLKPSNMVLRHRVDSLNDVSIGSELVIIDAGLAARCDGPYQRSLRCDETNGTPSFMAPEQIRPGATRYLPTRAIDAVALGRSFLLLFCNKLPFKGMEADAIFTSIRDGTLLSHLYPRCSLPAPAVFINVALWLTEHDASLRLSVQTACKIFAFILRRASTGDEVTVADVQTCFGLTAHKLLCHYPVVEAGQPFVFRNDGSLPLEHSDAAAVSDVKFANPATQRVTTDGTPDAVPETGAAEKPKIAGPSLADLMPVASMGAGIGPMACAMRRSTESGEGKDVQAGKISEHEDAAQYASEKEVEAVKEPGLQTTSLEIRSSTASVMSRPDIACVPDKTPGVVGDSPRILAFGERVTVHNCTREEFVLEPAAVRDSETVLNTRLETMVASDDNQVPSSRTVGAVLRRMKAGCISAAKRFATAVCCSGRNVQN